MARPASVTHYVLYGNLAGGEHWAAGWWGAGAIGSGELPADDYLDHIESSSQAQAFRAALLPIMSNQTSLIGVRAYAYEGAGGAARSYERVFGSGPYVGTGTVHPNQVALVATMSDGNAGARHRNRAYFPATGIAMVTGGLADAAVCQDLADAFADLIGGTAPAVVSVVGGTKLTTTSVVVDTVPDTQRRRRDGLTGSKRRADVTPYVP